jgi:hypothetical protein
MLGCFYGYRVVQRDTDRLFTSKSDPTVQVAFCTAGADWR